MKDFKVLFIFKCSINSPKEIPSSLWEHLLHSGSTYVRAQKACSNWHRLLLNTHTHTQKNKTKTKNKKKDHSFCRRAHHLLSEGAAVPSPERSAR